MTDREAFEILGLPIGAGAERVEAAYQRLVAVYRRTGDQNVRTATLAQLARAYRQLTLRDDDRSMSDQPAPGAGRVSPFREEAEENRLDGSRRLFEADVRTDDGRYDSFPVHDDYGDESEP